MLSIKMLIFLLFNSVSGDCVFTNVCPDPIFNCQTPHRIDPIPAFAINYTEPYACPMFLGSDVCCNGDQNNSMNRRFTLLGATFGHLVGGCDVCVANLKNLWCHFTCSPYQSQFVSAGEQHTVPNPANPSQEILVLRLNFTVTSELACSLYTSCKKCPYVTEVSAMQSPEGFLQFQGYESMTVSKTWTTFFLDDTGFTLDLATCDFKGDNLYGYDIEPCTCNNCENSCQGDFYAHEESTLYGIRWIVIVISYCVLAYISLVIILGKYFYRRRQQRIALAN